VETKVCTYCGCERDISEFYEHTPKDGIRRTSHRCRLCYNAIQRLPKPNKAMSVSSIVTVEAGTSADTPADSSGFAPETTLCRFCGCRRVIDDFRTYKEMDGRVYRNLRCVECLRIHDIKLKQKSREWLKSIKESLKCEKCGNPDSRVLDFHHRDPSEKEYNIMTLVGCREDLIRAEIAKCCVLCSNCHRILHCEEREKKGTLGRKVQRRMRRKPALEQPQPPVLEPALLANE